MDDVKLKEMKEKYGKVYKINLSGTEWFYRPMLRDEFSDYTNELTARAAERGEDISQHELEDLIFLKCNLNNISDLSQSKVPAGVVARIADEIMQAAGFSEDVVPEEL